jgi:hypothetical protein
MPPLGGRGKKPAKPLREGDRGVSRPSGLTAHPFVLRQRCAAELPDVPVYSKAEDAILTSRGRPLHTQRLGAQPMCPAEHFGPHPRRLVLSEARQHNGDEKFCACKGGTRMPTDNDNETGRAQENAKGGLLQSIGLLMLPLLAFQRNMLGIARAGINEASNLKPVQTLAQSELHALLMTMDKTGELRNSLGTDVEKELKDTLDAAVPKVISGSIMLIDAQQELLTSIIQALDKVRTSNASQK